MKLQTNQIYTFKLVTTEEITAKYYATKDGAFMIEKPVILAMSADSKGMEMYPYIITGNTDSKVPLMIASVVIAAPAKDEVAAAYTQSTSAIEISKPKEIILG